MKARNLRLIRPHVAALVYADGSAYRLQIRPPSLLFRKQLIILVVSGLTPLHKANDWSSCATSSQSVSNDFPAPRTTRQRKNAVGLAQKNMSQQKAPDRR